MYAVTVVEIIVRSKVSSPRSTVCVFLFDKLEGAALDKAHNVNYGIVFDTPHLRQF